MSRKKHPTSELARSQWNPESIGTLRSSVQRQKDGCLEALQINGVNVLYFGEYARVRSMSSAVTMIVLADTKEKIGDLLGSVILKMGKPKRQNGMVCGLADRQQVQHLLKERCAEAAQQLGALTSDLPILVFSHRTIEVFPMKKVYGGFKILECKCPGWVQGEGLSFDTQDAREQEWAVCPFCEKPFRMQFRD